VSRSASEPDSASLNSTRVGQPSRMGEARRRWGGATSHGTHRACRGDWGQRTRTDRVGTWEIRRGGGDGLDARREDITAGRLRRKSERSIVASKRGNSRGAKGPRRRYVFVRREACRLKHFITAESEGRRDAGLPMTVATLRRKLALKAKREPKSLFVSRQCLWARVGGKAGCGKSARPV